jgi:transposase
MRSIGLDVGKHVAEVAIAETGSATRRAGRLEATPAALREFARTLRADDQVALEATTNTWAIVELLEAHAGRVVVSNPLRTRAIADAKVKTDTIDATTLAELLAADYLPAVWQPDPATRALRRRVAARAALVAERTRLRNRVSNVLGRNLVRCPATDPFGKAGRRWLAAVPLPPDERDLVDGTIRLHDALQLEIDALERAIARAVVDDRRVHHLLSIPGVGIQTAVALVAVIGDVRRFGRPGRLVGYLGLDPRVHQSGGRPARPGHISRAGQGHVRGVLVEAAHAAVRSPGPLRAFHARIAKRRGGGIAMIAVARKLTVLAWHLLSDDVDYRWAPAVPTAAKIRAVELLAGAPSRRGQVRGRPDGRSLARRQRDQEQAVLSMAEAAYAEFVRSRRAADAAAAKRGATGEAMAEARQAARQSWSPSSALRHGVDRVRSNDTTTSGT